MQKYVGVNVIALVLIVQLVKAFPPTTTSSPTAPTTGGTCITPNCVPELVCPYGFDVDAEGCEICVCNTSPPTTPYLPSPTCGTPCDMAMQCTYGQSIGTDEFGCQICECNPGPSITTTLGFK